MANYYDLLIDSPSSSSMFKEILAECEAAGIVNKEQVQAYIKHMESVQASIDQGYN